MVVRNYFDSLSNSTIVDSSKVAHALKTAANKTHPTNTLRKEKHLVLVLSKQNKAFKTINSLTAIAAIWRHGIIAH